MFTNAYIYFLFVFLRGGLSVKKPLCLNLKVCILLSFS